MSGSSDLLLAVFLIGGFAIAAIGATLWNRAKAHAARGKLNDYDYVVFETEPSELRLLQADLTSHGWRLASTTHAEGATSLYRFERTGAHSAKLGDICLDFDRYMPLTASRKSETLIKIKDHGLKRPANDQTH